MKSLPLHWKSWKEISSNQFDKRVFSNTHIYLQHDNFLGSFTYLQMPFISLSKLRVPGRRTTATQHPCERFLFVPSTSARTHSVLTVTWHVRNLDELRLSFSGSAKWQEGSRIRIWCYVRLSLLPRALVDVIIYYLNTYNCKPRYSLLCKSKPNSEWMQNCNSNKIELNIKLLWYMVLLNIELSLAI